MQQKQILKMQQELMHQKANLADLKFDVDNTFYAKINEVENKIHSITNLATSAS